MNRSVWFPGDLAPRVEAEARRQDRSFNYVVVRALESMLGKPSADVLPPKTEEIREYLANGPPRASARHVPSAPGDLPRGVKTARQVAMERQRRLNEGKG